jgi:hypothetical protein
MLLPPNLEVFKSKFPTVLPSSTIDRTVIRCWYCEYKLADKQAMDAEFPPPTHVNLVKKIEEDIFEAHQLIKEGASLKDLLPVMWNAWETARRERYKKIESAWKEFREIWGSDKIIPDLSVGLPISGDHTKTEGLTS